MRTDQQQANLTGVRHVAGGIMSMLCVLVMALALAVAPVRSARAEDASALTQEASLMIRYGYTSQGVTKYIDGAEVSLYKVADLDDNINFYTTLAAFESLGVNFNEGLDANNAQKVADKAAALVKSKKVAAVKKMTTTTQGTAAFGTLPYGVYLVVQTGATGTAKDYYDFDPFLISVPSLEEDRIVYNVVTEPKTSPRPEVKPPESKPPLAKTGDLANPQLWAICFVAGAALLVAGVALRHKRTGRS